MSDYGHADEFVGVVHSVIRSIAPHVAVVDLVHDLRPFDVRGASLALSRAVQYVAPGIVLAIVDPGVGSDRRAIAVEVGKDGEGVLIGPDNGLLAPAVAMSGGAVRAVSLTNPDYQLAPLGPTFAGRDVFAPAAAHLANGVAFTDLGPEIDPYSLVPGLIPLSRVEDGAIVGEVLWVDRFGNCQLNVDPADLGPGAVVLRAGDVVRRAKRVTSFVELGGAEVGVLVDSYGLLAIVVDRGSAAETLQLHAGAQVRLESGEDG
ncbi:MAG: SAM hydrolase/SAM-dependent halogenase family protein [Acidimicrobiales bacterium]